MRHGRLLFLIILMVTSPVLVLATEQNVIRFNVTPTGYPPYLIHNPSEGIVGGLMYDVLHTIATKHGFTVQALAFPRARVNHEMDRHNLDATARAVSWEAEPQKYLFTDPIIDTGELIFTLQNHPKDYKRLEDLFGRTVITHLGYQYASLSPYFSSGQILRTDAVNIEGMFRMLLARRGDCLIMDEAVGWWIIKESGLDAALFKTHHITLGSGYREGYRIMFTPQWARFIQIFNRELALMRQNGSLATIIAKYR
jgi:polar amino acid transport system substrate-binding protein